MNTNKHELSFTQRNISPSRTDSCHGSLGMNDYAKDKVEIKNLLPSCYPVKKGTLV